MERALLRSCVRAGWLYRVLLQRPVHPLVRPVVLRLAGARSLQPDAELEKPYRQFGKTEQGARRAERDAIVGADHLRKAVLAEGVLEAQSCCAQARALQPAAEQQIPAVGVCDRERIAEMGITEAKLSLEIGRPDAIGLISDSTRRAPELRRTNIGDPEVCICDEPSVGDPTAIRRQCDPNPAFSRRSASQPPFGRQSRRRIRRVALDEALAGRFQIALQPAS